MPGLRQRDGASGTREDRTAAPPLADAALAELALGATVAAVAIADRNGTLVFVNAPFLRLWGYGSAPEVLGRNALDLWCDPEAARTAVTGLARDGRWQGELVARRADGTHADLRVAASVFRDAGAQSHWVATFEDVSELRATRQRLQEAQRIAGLGSWSADLDARSLCLSDEAAAILGVAQGRSELPLGSLLLGVHPEDRDRLERAVERLRGGGEPLELDLRLPSPSGGWRVVHVEARVVTDAREQPARLHGVFQDVTRRVRLEEQLRHAQKAEVVGRFAAGIAHDFNNLLTVVRSSAHLLKAKWAVEANREELLGEIALAAERGSDLVRQILTFGRPHAPAPRVVSLQDAIAAILPLLRRLLRDGVQLAHSLDPGAGCALLDPTQLERVVVNLVVNAHDAIPRGGSLSIALRPERLDEAGSALHGVAAGDYVVLEVRDSGQGISKDALPHVFEPFFTTKKAGKGSGLGLAIVEEIARLAGGFADAANDPGGGACFSVHFPRVGCEPVRALVPPVTEVDLSGHETILVVEDDSSLRWLVSSLLELNGYRVITARGRDEAIQLLRGAHAPPELLLSDVEMAGTSGPELAREAAGHGVRNVLFMSAHPEEVARAEAGEAPIGGVLAKPFDPLHLLRAVRATIGASAACMVKTATAVPLAPPARENLPAAEAAVEGGSPWCLHPP